MLIKFSIILPTYNCNYVERAIDSVLSQTYKLWELIVIDNHSKNDVFKIIKKKNNNKIRYYKINNSGIIGKSRNLGIRKSKNNWIAFLDSDDTWSRDKLEKVFKHIKKNDCDLIYHNMKIISKNGISSSKNLYNYKKKNPILKYDDLILNSNDIIQSSVVVKKKIIQKVNYISENKKFIAWEDFDLWLKISKITNKFCFLEQSLGGYYLPDNEEFKLNRYFKNIKNFKKIYKNEIKNVKKKYKISYLDWIEYNEGLYFFKKEKYRNALIKFLKIKKKNIRIIIYVVIIKFQILLSKFNTK